MISGAPKVLSLNLLQGLGSENVQITSGCFENNVQTELIPLLFSSELEALLDVEVGTCRF